MLSTYDAYAVVNDTFDSLRWIAVIVIAMLTLEAIAMSGGGDDDPDGFT